MNKIIKEPDTYIEDYFQRLINQIDLEREDKKKLIDEWHEYCFQEIQRFKIEFFTKLNNESTEINETIKEFRKKEQIFQKKISVSKLTAKDYTYENIDRNLYSFVQFLKEKINEFQMPILDVSGFEFGSKRSILSKDFEKIQVVKKVLYNLVIF